MKTYSVIVKNGNIKATFKDDSTVVEVLEGKAVLSVKREIKRLAISQNRVKV